MPFALLASLLAKNFKNTKNTFVTISACFAIMSTLKEVIVESASEDNSLEDKEEAPKTPILDNNPHDNEIPLTWKTKGFRIGSGNVIGKSVIQEFFTSTGVIL